ncbi:MAG: IclR family transcriptional regulator domain-containing protein [Georgenia sp.]
MARSDSGDSLLTRMMRILEVFASTPSPSVAERRPRRGAARLDGAPAGARDARARRLGARGTVPNIARTAERLPAHTVSAGLVLLAHAPAEVRDGVLAGPLEAFTPHVLTGPVLLRGTLGTVRRLGYAVAPGLLTPGAKGVAVPLRDASGTVVAALSVIVPMREDHRALVPALLAPARAISRDLGNAPIEREDRSGRVT